MNRLITQLILAFAATSLVVTLIPLVQSSSGVPLLGFLDREHSLALYASYLTVFLAFVLPVFMARDDPGRTVIAWAAVAGYVLLFAAIPLVFTAYISGVNVRGLISVAAICAAAPGLGLAARRWLGRRAWSVTLTLVCGLLFVLPALLLYLESVGQSNLAAATALSPLTWIHRVSRQLEVPESWPFISVAVGLWLLALVPRRQRVTEVVAGLISVLVLLTVAWTPASASWASAVGNVTVESLGGGVCRAGFRTPLRVTAGPAAGQARIRIGDWSTWVPADGQPRVVLAIPGVGDSSLEVTLEGASRVLPLPAELVPEQVRLVGRLGVGADRAAGLSGRARVVALDPALLPLPAGALEAFDVLLLEKSAFAALAPGVRAQLERYAALGGHLVLLDEGASTETVVPYGVGDRVTLSPTQLASFDPSPRLAWRRWALDTGLIQTFANPRWQEMDLSALIMFAVIYHVAFLLAFLLPLLIDSRKTVVVYLVSVGFVVVVVALLAFHVLGRIFLKDNQVYTQSITLLVQSEGPAPILVGRQLLCYASMSEETRDLHFKEGTDLIPYRPENGGRPTVLDRDENGPFLRGVLLDRRLRKTLVRVDRVGEPPLRVRPVAGPGTVFKLEPVAGVDDPWGLLQARVEFALLVRGASRRRLEADGFTLRESAVQDPGKSPQEVYLRRLLGPFVPPVRNYLLVALSGLRRPDDPDRYLWVRDLGGFLLVPLPPG